jgi:glycosyltransferase involved in cell wall biosynthesis
LFRDVPIRCIPHGLDQGVFSPKQTDEERKKMEIGKDKKVILFIADSVSNVLKGFSLLYEALGETNLTDTTLLSVGGGTPRVPEDVSHRHLGRVDDDHRLALLYSLADLFVIPSLQEAFGQTALEAMACGTPVVGFDTGGIPDMVRPGETGWLAEPGDVSSLRRKIDVALAGDKERERRARRCREVVEREYTLERQAKRYECLYSSI